MDMDAKRGTGRGRIMDAVSALSSVFGWNFFFFFERFYTARTSEKNAKNLFFGAPVRSLLCSRDVSALASRDMVTNSYLKAVLCGEYAISNGMRKRRQ